MRKEQRSLLVNFIRQVTGVIFASAVLMGCAYFSVKPLIVWYENDPTAFFWTLFDYRTFIGWPIFGNIGHYFETNDSVKENGGAIVLFFGFEIVTGVINLLVCLFLVFQSYRIGLKIASSLTVLLYNLIATGSVLWFLNSPAFQILNLGQYETSDSFTATLHAIYYLIASVTFVGISHDVSVSEFRGSLLDHRLQTSFLSCFCFGTLFFASNIIAIASGDWENVFQSPQFWLLEYDGSRTFFFDTAYSLLFVMFLLAGLFWPHRQPLRVRHFVATAVLIAMFCTAIYPNTSDYGKACFEPLEFQGAQILDLCFFVVCIGVYGSVFTLLEQMATIARKL